MQLVTHFPFHFSEKSYQHMLKPVAEDLTPSIDSDTSQNYLSFLAIWAQRCTAPFDVATRDKEADMVCGKAVVGWYFRTFGREIENQDLQPKYIFEEASLSLISCSSLVKTF